MFVEKQLQKPIEKLYEDEYFVVFNKPSGLLVIATPKAEKNTLAAIVNDQYGLKEESGRLYPCHRLDRETSGAIIFAKGRPNEQLMVDVFKKQAIKKSYIAFVHGHLQRNEGE